MIDPVYLDLHIHTSENPDKLNPNYDVNLLINKIEGLSKGYPFLISLTDHNTINKKVYLELLSLTKNVLLGAELHIKNYDSEPYYHCHIFFDIRDIEGENIDEINGILDSLYPCKNMGQGENKNNKIGDIANAFNKYNFLLLPHGGQTHGTFNRSIPEGAIFDTTIERSVYYNYFDGFTARSNSGLQETKDYLAKLGIGEFVNLVTCTDNYSPANYPCAKNDDASPFVATWMFANPTFGGLRVSLSEKSRLEYGDCPQSNHYEHIKRVSLNQDNIMIDTNLTEGLNVVIGGSSSGKTLFVDSIYNSITSDFSKSDYSKFGVKDIEVVNPSGMFPHYINQNFITTVLAVEDEHVDIGEIAMIRNAFPVEASVEKEINDSLDELRVNLRKLINSVKEIDSCKEALGLISVFSRLIQEEKLDVNLFSCLLPKQEWIDKIHYADSEYKKDLGSLDKIEKFLNENPFASNLSDDFNSIKEELFRINKISNFEIEVRNVVKEYEKTFDDLQEEEKKEEKRKEKSLKSLKTQILRYVKNKDIFDKSLEAISEYKIEPKTKSVSFGGHRLKKEYLFKLNKNILLDSINKFLKKQQKIKTFEDINPEKLFKSNHSKQNPKVKDYDDFSAKIFKELEGAKKEKLNITTRDGKDFYEISPGWQTSVLLDIILDYDKDYAPLIIDQPEDNLATNYINKGLISALKETKKNRQIIIVSHNATIPMLGDAQNIILCSNDNGRIVIKSEALEGIIDNTLVLDHIAKLTDGGKAAIKKRVKKYNLKCFRGEDDAIGVEER